jgi:hypothetical protein
MFMFAGRLVLALVLMAPCLGARTAHAQAAPVSYWTPGWPLGFGGNLTASEGANTYGNFPSFVGSDSGGFSYSRYNFSNGLFVGAERGGMGLSGISQSSFGSFGSLTTEGVQFGYNFKGANGMPVTVYAGFDTLKYNTGIGGAFSPFDSRTGTVPGYSAHAGIEFKPTSNLSLSLGASITQQSGRIDSDTSSPALLGDSPYALVGGRR